MKKRLCAGLIAAATAFFSLAVPVVPYAQETEKVEIPELEEGTYVGGEALVSMSTTETAALTKEGVADFDKDIQIEECWDFGQAEDTDSERIKDYVALVSSEKYSTEELMEIVSKKYYVDAVAPNSYMHLCAIGKDTLADYQWYMDGTGALQTRSAGIDRSADQIAAAVQPVVAVIDTGVDHTNEELKDSMWVNPYRSQGLPGTYGYDFADEDADPMDTDGHGTHCAGVIAAQAENGLGIAGISNAKIMALKVMGDGEELFNTASAVAAYEYIVKAQQLGVQIAAVNCSWGGGRDTGKVMDRLIDKIGENGALTVFAAGNDAINWDAVAPYMRQTPYDLESKYIVVVGASNEYDRRAYFSDYGNTQVDLFAPGSNILSTVPEAQFLPQFWDSDKRSRMTVYYNTVSSANSLYTAADIPGLKTDYVVQLSYGSEAGFFDNPNGSLKYTVRYNGPKGTSKEEGDGLFENGKEMAGFVYIDVTSFGLDTDRTYYVSALMSDDAGSGTPTWETFEKVSGKEGSRFLTIGGKTYLALFGITTRNTKDQTFYLDDLAVSVADPDTSQFEKCDLKSGSSMAAPMVTGAIALLRGVNPSSDAGSIRRLLMDCTRSVSAIENACVTGGILDLSGVAVLATKIRLNKTTASVRVGRSLQLKASVSPMNVTDATVKWTSSNKRYATVSASGKVTVRKAGIGKTVKITAMTKDGTKLKKTCKIKIKKS